MGLMATALATLNESRGRNPRESAAREEPSALGVGNSFGGRWKSAKGKLYTFGSGDYGRLGHGDNQPKKTAKLVEVLRDKDIIKFACGPRHTLALASDGTIYSWGFGGDGQLGHGDFQLQTMPTKIKALQDEHVINISCGEKHSAALTSGGDVFTWGDGSLGQLGLGDQRKQHTPHRVVELQGRMILQISCGYYHTACIDQDENVYTWGQGGSGRLGHDHEHDLAVPTLVESLRGRGIQGVRCFHEHTVALTVPLEGCSVGIFDEQSQVRLLQKVKELEVKLSRESLIAKQAQERLETSKSAFIECEQNAARLQLQNDALLAERVDLYMKMQSLESSLSVAATERDNLDKELKALVNIPTKWLSHSPTRLRNFAAHLSPYPPTTPFANMPLALATHPPNPGWRRSPPKAYGRLWSAQSTSSHVPTLVTFMLGVRVARGSWDWASGAPSTPHSSYGA